MADRSNLTLADIHKDDILRTLHERSERNSGVQPNRQGRAGARSDSPGRSERPNPPGPAGKLRPARDVIRDRDRESPAKTGLTEGMAELVASSMAAQSQRSASTSVRSDRDKYRRIREWAEDVAAAREWRPPVDLANQSSQSRPLSRTPSGQLSRTPSGQLAEWTLVDTTAKGAQSPVAPVQGVADIGGTPIHAVHAAPVQEVQVPKPSPPLQSPLQPPLQSPRHLRRGFLFWGDPGRKRDSR